MCSHQNPHKPSFQRSREDLSLATNEMDSVLEGNDAGKVGLTLCSPRQKALADFYNRMRSSIEQGHTPKPFKKNKKKIHLIIILQMRKLVQISNLFFMKF